jgi:hypothetical protein
VKFAAADHADSFESDSVAARSFLRIGAGGCGRCVGIVRAVT